MDNVIDLTAHRIQQRQEELVQAQCDMFTFMFDIYLHYCVYPAVAAMMSAHAKRIVKVSHY